MLQLKEFRTNLQSSLVSFTTYEEREYMVVPCVALVPGVLNRDLVTLDTVAGTFAAWNGRPLVVDHPYDDGGAISANDPEVLKTHGIGQIWYTDIDDDKLRVQAWLDTAKATRLGGDARKVIDMIKAGSPVEVSTGYWASMRAQRGVYGNAEYDNVTETIIPDHLALLPNAIGACSWADGCGIPRINKATSPMDEETTMLTTLPRVIKKAITPNMTVKDQFKALATLISQEMEAEGIDSWRWHMVDIEDTYVIIGMDNLYKRRAFTTGEDGNPTFSGEWETVHQQTTFVPVANAHQCESCKLASQSETEAPEAEESQESTGDDKEAEEEEATTTEDDDMSEVTTQQQVDTLKTFLEQLGVNEEDVKLAVQARQMQRKGWSDVIKANSQLADADIATMSDAALEQMAKAVTPIMAEDASDLMNYAGRGLPGQSVQANQHPLERPQGLLKSVS